MSEFNEEPQIDFRGRRPAEKVILLVRYHKWLLMPIVWWWLVALAAIAAFLYFFGASAISSLAIGVIGVVLILFSLYRWFLWVGGNYIITNQRVIRTNQVSLFKRQISEAEITRIQEIATQVDGPIHTLLGFGTVQIRTTAGGHEVDIVDVANPYDIQQEIARIQRQVGEEHQPPRARMQ